MAKTHAPEGRGAGRGGAHARDTVPEVRRKVRPRTIASKRLTREELVEREVLEPLLGVPRPRLRCDCRDAPRPCPFVGCKYHLYLDVNASTGSIKLNFPDRDVWEMAESCALDVAERGGTTLEDVGAILNLTRERIRQVEVRALHKLRVGAPRLRC